MDTTDAMQTINRYNYNEIQQKPVACYMQQGITNQRWKQVSWSLVTVSAG